MDESRKQFEEWMSDRYDTRLLRDGEGYMGQTVQSMWLSWQASRADIEIELPPTVDGSNVPFAGNAWNAYRVEAVKAIRAAGIKVKE